jgi:hypothetical protein
MNRKQCSAVRHKGTSITDYQSVHHEDWVLRPGKPKCRFGDQSGREEEVQSVVQGTTTADRWINGSV